ncbi:hypothetical protein AURDEDRAFT_162359 [Auricularia subglabra TFB-10046 SS5]|nr:hypothetical protein AURDEDRAFT_162359 [Auricularia subglabra TFB-10046 SS5]
MRAARNIERSIGLPCLATSRGLKAAWRDIQSVIYKLQMYQLAHEQDSHELAAVAMCWSRLCVEPLIRDKVVQSKPFRDGFVTFLREDRCELCVVSGAYLFTVLCLQTGARESSEAASLFMLGAAALLRQFVAALTARAQTVIGEFTLEIARAYFAVDSSHFASATLSQFHATTLMTLVNALPLTFPPAFYGVTDLIIENAHLVDDLDSECNRSLLLFLLGVLHCGGAHDKLRVLRVLLL